MSGVSVEWKVVASVSRSPPMMESTQDRMQASAKRKRIVTTTHHSPSPLFFSVPFWYKPADLHAGMARSITFLPAGRNREIMEETRKPHEGAPHTLQGPHWER